MRKLILFFFSFLILSTGLKGEEVRRATLKTFNSSEGKRKQRDASLAFFFLFSATSALWFELR